MKRLLALALVLVLMIGLLCGCNRTVLNVTFDYERAMITLPNGEVIEGKVEKWTDWEDGTVEVFIDGKSYYTHSVNVILISE